MLKPATLSRPAGSSPAQINDETKTDSSEDEYAIPAITKLPLGRFKAVACKAMPRRRAKGKIADVLHWLLLKRLHQKLQP